MNASGALIETFAFKFVVGVYFYPNMDSVKETNHRRGMVSGESPEPATRRLHETPRRSDLALRYRHGTDGEVEEYLSQWPRPYIEGEVARGPLAMQRLDETLACLEEETLP